MSGPSEYDVAHMGEIVADSPHFTWFDCHLLRLIKKADVVNRARLAIIYPLHVAALERWEHQPDAAMATIHSDETCAS